MASDKMYENQINNVNKLGNSLLANLFMLKNVENRKLANISNVLSKSSKQIERYRSEKAKLQAFQIAICHVVLEEKRINDNQEDCKDAVKSMKEIENILNHHLKYNAEHILSKAEFEEIEREKLIGELCNKLKMSENGNESTVELRKRLKSIQNLEEASDNTISLMKTAGIDVDSIQNQTISNVSDILESVTYIHTS